MDSRDLLIIAAVGFGAWWLWKRSQAAGQPAVDANPAGASSMTAGAAGQTQAGTGRIAGLFSGGGASFPIVNRAAATTARFARSAATLIGVDNTPQPVATVPTVIAGPTLGVYPTLGQQPPPNPPMLIGSGRRGIL